MYSRIYRTENGMPVEARLSIGELVQVDGSDECSCNLTLKGPGIDYDVNLFGIDQIQAFENALSLLRTLEEKERIFLAE